MFRTIKSWRLTVSNRRLVAAGCGLTLAILLAVIIQAPNFLRQGVTTLITGNCGRSRMDVATLFRGLEKNGSDVNVATLIGHNSIRREVMGEEARAPSTAELERMRQLVDRAMDSGALGLSTGLIYSPGRIAKREELVALAKAAARGGGVYVSHIRDEGRGGMTSIREAIEIGREAEAATHISHFKSSGPAQWDSMTGRLRLLDVARASGHRVTIDVYPYNRSSTTTDVLLPDWAVEDRHAGLMRAAQDRKTRQRLREEILKKLRQDGWPDLKHLRLATGQPDWIGKTLAEAPELANDLNGQIENLIAVSLRGGALASYADMREADVEQATTYPHSVFGSDSAVRDPDWLYKPHPRDAGTFPRIFRLYVREKPLIQIGQAVRKSGGQAAEIFGLAGRGVLRPGAWADIVIFDPARIEDHADYDNPFTEPAGIDYVLVNGSVAVDQGALTGSPPSGMALRKQSPSLLD